VQAMTDH